LMTDLPSSRGAPDDASWASKLRATVVLGQSKPNTRIATESPEA
jgi:hypothetical protein